ncbi:MAG: metallophosphoesterase [Planctomycetes bacterium]|nr:metallophosphoesterase [Planctomycetota bacterium]
MNQTASTGRRIFIGDVQGCLDELECLLDELAYRAHADRLFFVGDLVRKGPASAGVLRLAKALRATCVLGNHDFDVLVGGKCPKDLASASDRDELLEFVRSWPWMLDLGDILLVHAAPPPRCWSLRKEEAIRPPKDAIEETDDRRFALTTRYCDATGRTPIKDWPPPGDPFRPWHDFYTGERMVVYGHWARQGLHSTHNTRGLDTGCVYGKELTAWIADEDRFVSVPASR